MADEKDESLLSDEDYVVLKDEDGKEIEFVQIATIDYDGEWYSFLQPTDLGSLEEDEMIIFKVEEDENGDDIFVPVEDQDLIDKVYKEYVDEYETEFCDGECGMCEDKDCPDRQ